MKKIILLTLALSLQSCAIGYYLPDRVYKIAFVKVHQPEKKYIQMLSDKYYTGRHYTKANTLKMYNLLVKRGYDCRRLSYQINNYIDFSCQYIYCYKGNFLAVRMSTTRRTNSFPVFGADHGPATEDGFEYLKKRPLCLDLSKESYLKNGKLRWKE